MVIRPFVSNHWIVPWAFSPWGLRPQRCSYPVKSWQKRNGKPWKRSSVHWGSGGFSILFCILAFTEIWRSVFFWEGWTNLATPSEILVEWQWLQWSYVKFHVKTRPWKNAQLCTWSPKALSQSEPALCAPRPSWLEFRNLWDLERCHGATFIFYIVFFLFIFIEWKHEPMWNFHWRVFQVFSHLSKSWIFWEYRFSFWGSWDSCWRPKVWGWISSVVRNLQTGNLISAGTLKIVTWRLIEGIFFNLLFFCRQFQPECVFNWVSMADLPSWSFNCCIPASETCLMPTWLQGDDVARKQHTDFCSEIFSRLVKGWYPS